MRTLSYPSFSKFPTAATANPLYNYLAADTGALYCVLARTYRPFWPSSANPRDYQKPGIIGSNRNLQDTVHVRS